MMSSKTLHKISPESKKELSKRQAKERRDRERHEFDRLASLLPDSPTEKNYNLQIALGYIYLRLFFKQFHKLDTNQLTKTTKFLNEQSIDGFLIAFTVNGSGSGKILYVSESCYGYTGFESKFIVGRHIYDLISKNDHDILASQVGMKDLFLWSAETETYIQSSCQPVENGLVF